MNEVWLLRGQKAVAKKFGHPVAYEHEVSFWLKYPELTPGIRKLMPEELTLVSNQGNLIERPTPEQVCQLSALVAHMRDIGVHHRDLHPGNIVEVGGRLSLIDWETAIEAPGRSYDLFGPVDVPVPVQHGGLIPQWWNSNDSGSIKNVWGFQPSSFCL